MAEDAPEKPYENDRMYEVRLMRVAYYRGAKFLPLLLHEMTGEVLNEIVAEYGAGAVDSAVEKD
jgi:hypothetical protein